MRDRMNRGSRWERKMAGENRGGSGRRRKDSVTGRGSIRGDSWGSTPEVTCGTVPLHILSLSQDKHEDEM